MKTMRSQKRIKSQETNEIKSMFFLIIQQKKYH